METVNYFLFEDDWNTTFNTKIESLPVYAKKYFSIQSKNNILCSLSLKRAIHNSGVVHLEKEICCVVAF